MTLPEYISVSNWLRSSDDGVESVYPDIFTFALPIASLLPSKLGTLPWDSYDLDHCWIVSCPHTDSPSWIAGTHEIELTLGRISDHVATGMTG